MPVDWLKLLAFAFGAAVAALRARLFAALNGSVFPQTFSFALLITLYTMVILGGVGSQAGVVLGAIFVSVMLELLREPERLAGAVLRVVIARPARASSGPPSSSPWSSWRRLVAFGFVGARNRGAASTTAWVDGSVGEESEPARRLGSRVGDRPDRPRLGMRHRSRTSRSSRSLLSLDVLRGWARIVVLVPTLYLAAFVWENVMLAKPEATRYILLGAMLVGADDLRPDRAARREASGDRLDGRPARAARGDDGVRWPELSSTASTSTSTRARSSASSGRTAPARRRCSTSITGVYEPIAKATSCSRAAASWASIRTRSRSAASRERSRRCACSSTCPCART